MELWKLIVSYYSELDFYNLVFEDPLRLLYFVGAFAVGGIASVIAAYVSRHRTGRIVDPMLGLHAHDEQTAISPSEGKFDDPRLLMMLKRGSMLRRTVAATEPEQENGEKPVQPTRKAMIACLMQMRFYIPDERRAEAERRYSAKRNGIAALAFSIAIVLALTVLVYLFLPVVLRMVDNFLNMTGGNV